MVLSKEGRQEVLAHYVMYKNAKREDVPLDVPPMFDAICAMDDWLEKVKDMLDQSSTPDGNQKITYKDKLLIMTWLIQARVDTQYP